jgi:flagellar biosynthetic protein FlhB
VAEESSQDRQLDPTAKRIEQARERGQFAQSRDVTTFAMIIGLFGFVIGIGPILFRQMLLMVQQGLRFSQPIFLLDHLAEWALGSFFALAITIGLIMIPVWFIAILAPLALAGFRPVFAFKLDISKLDPISGIGRMLSTNALVEVFKNLLKIILLMGIGLIYLYGLFGYASRLIQGEFIDTILYMVEFLVKGLGLLLFPLALIALLDGVYQWFKFQKQMKMSPEEVKQETKESEGSPEIKQRLRQKQRQIAASRMMAAIERADVVLANPEHYSIALRYDSDKMAAPIVVAKGTDALALRIQAVAKDHDVPIAQIPSLARYLYSQLDIGESIPTPLFEAIAKVLAWAYETKESDGRAKELPQITFIPEQIHKNRPILA